MAHPSGDTPLLDPSDFAKHGASKSEQEISQPVSPTFPNTISMNSTTDLSRNPGVYDDVFKKIKGMCK